MLGIAKVLRFAIIILCWAAPLEMTTLNTGSVDLEIGLRLEPNLHPSPRGS